MTVNYKLLIYTVCALLLVLLIQKPLLKKNTALRRFLLFLAEFILAAAVSMLIVVSTSNFLRQIFVINLGIYIALLAAAAVNLLMAVVGIFRKKPARYYVTVLLTALLALALFFYGNYNAFYPTVKEYTVKSDKISEAYTVAFISDTHFGYTVKADKLSVDVSLINKLKPDCVILGGDITDDRSTKEDMENAYAILSGLDCEVYFVCGNHDLQRCEAQDGGASYTEQELINAIEAAGITVLRDEAVSLRDDILLLGRQDAGEDDRKSVEELSDILKNTRPFLLVADHQPYETEDILAIGAEVQLSGHSHDGQLFPNNYLYRLLGYDSYGEYEIGSTKLIVSSGAGGCGELFRTAGHSEIVLLTLEP